MVGSLSKILEPPNGWRPKQAGVISPKDFQTLLMRLDLKDKDPVLVMRDNCMLWMCYASAFRAVEVAGWLVKEAMYPNGQICSMTRIRAAATKGSLPTIAPVVVKQQRAILEAWLSMRVEKGIMLGNSKRYRGLNPDSPVFPRYYAAAWGHWAPTRKVTKGKQYLVHTNLQTHLSKLHQHYGFPQCSSHSGRRSVTDALRRKGVEPETIQGVLGHSCIDSQLVYSDLDLAAFDSAHENLFATRSPIKLTQK
ncbi:tyrosine-type recombinase/integrase [Neiella marina]|uniref:Tyrosine-type recombinase/integrase n=1 Tax=Neiella holothuriorum TaxID=2870530 RepID=A0ABS7EG41_9GAMM|nr:tyrosine-type recombinase/integrase [Neiella holothuriorum]MBW8191307.1 tyrosine-type recombinase/integrase [Neiella holothuriorum]